MKQTFSNHSKGTGTRRFFAQGLAAALFAAGIVVSGVAVFQGCTLLGGEYADRSWSSVPVPPRLIVKNQTSSTITSIGLSNNNPDAGGTIDSAYKKQNLSIGYGGEITIVVPEGSYYFNAADAEMESRNVMRVYAPLITFANDQIITVTITSLRSSTGLTYTVTDNGDNDKDNDNDNSNTSVNAIDLTSGYWYNNTLSAGEIHWYRFTAEAYTIYMVSWNDSDDGNGTKTCDVKVSAYRGSPTGDAIFTAIDSAYNTRQPIYTSSSSGYIYLKVEGYNSSSSGTYAIGYLDG
ncbi:MAG: hypothetical protein LBR16_01070 [Treponema sp.]|jgi:hypothetical protein|nr:hypothetical protein [Treponema sp.]